MSSRLALLFAVLALAAAAVACPSTTTPPGAGDTAATPVPGPADVGAAVETPPAMAPDASAAAKEPDAAPAQAPPAGGGPAEAYTAALKAWNRHERDAYVSAFADKLSCFHGKKDATRDDVKAARTRDDGGEQVLKEGAVWHRAPEVHAIDDATTLLVDRGVSLDEDGRPLVHEKAILMRRGEGGWKIAGEAPLAGASCLGVDLGAAKPDPATATCQKKAATCARACPCDVASNGCEMCKDSCTNDAAACMGVTLE